MDNLMNLEEYKKTYEAWMSARKVCADHLSSLANNKLQIFDLFERLDKFHRIFDSKDILIHYEGGDWGSYWYFSPRASIRSLASLSAQDCILE